MKTAKAGRTVLIIATVLALLTLAACVHRGKEEPQPKPKEAIPTREQVKLAPNAEVLKPIWPEASKIDQKARSMLSAENLRAVDSSPAPVLLPKDPEFLKNGIMMVQPYSYGFTSEAIGVGVLFDSAGIAYRYSDLPKIVPPPTYEVRGKLSSVVENSEVGLRAGWNENGVVYEVKLDCDDGNDVRCKTPDFLLKIINEAVYVGGRGKE